MGGLLRPAETPTIWVLDRPVWGRVKICLSPRRPIVLYMVLGQSWANLVSTLQALPGWQAFLIIVLASVIAAAIIQIGGDRLIKRITARIEGDIDDIIFHSIHPPLYISAILLGALLARDVLSLGQSLEFTIEATVLSALTIVWAATLINIGRKLSAELTTDEARGKSVVPIFQNVWSALIVGGSAYLILTFWNIDVTPLLASAGILGIVVGLAARDSIANFFGSIALYTDGTYRVGDYIVIESGERGRVEDISIRSTVIRTRDDVLVTIPNSELNSAVIINESSPRSRYRIRSRIGVAYGTDIDEVEEILLAAVDDIDIILETPRPRVRFREFGNSALQLDVLCWVRSPVQRGRATHKLNKAIYAHITDAGIEIPFPQRSIHLEGVDYPEQVTVG